MKSFLTLAFCFLLFNTNAQNANAKRNKGAKFQIVETSCGQCNFGLPGDGCDLAVRINGIAYFVDGTSIDKHGDAHAKDGFCNAIRKAKVKGKIKDNRYKATYFELVKKS